MVYLMDRSRPIEMTQELREITKKLSGIAYQWEVGEYSRASGRVPITYLIGSPQAHLSTS
jgi:hypothetical protein